jgi:hypothetical protein
MEKNMHWFLILYWLIVLSVIGIPIYLLCRLMWAMIKKLEKENGGK